MKPFVALLFFAVAAAVGSPTIDPEVRSAMGSKGFTTVILHFKGDKTSDVLAKYHQIYRPFELAVHHDVLPNLLIANAAKSQASTVEFLKARGKTSASGGNIFQLWILNQLIVRDVDAELLKLLEVNPAISRIEADKTYQILAPRQLPPVEVPQELEVGILETGNVTNQWGVENVGAPEVWALGFSGKNVTIGSIDTGVRPSHISISKQYRSAFGWFDAVVRLPWAYDDHGHGTHTVGTMVGGYGLGVAPNASWIACKALSLIGAGTDSSLRSCGQFMLCPTDVYGLRKDCSKRPTIINNSWGSTESSPFYNDIIDAWIAAGIIPIFANGNSGDKCNTTGSPADYPAAISVGATNITNTVAVFSSRGPTVNGTIKPDVSAPGQNITSASFLCDRCLASMSGTSMAAPHVAGVSALIASARAKFPALNAGGHKGYLVQSSQPTTVINQTCGGVADSTYPNNVVGAGRVFAPALFTAS